MEDKNIRKRTRKPGLNEVVFEHGKIPPQALDLEEAVLGAMMLESNRLAEVIEACVTPQCAADIVPVLFKRKLDLHQMTFAMGEALAHLHALYYEGKLTRCVGDDGIIRFVRT